MSPRRRAPAGSAAEATAPEPTPQAGALPNLPRGRIPTVGMREIVAALHRRRERRRASAAELSAALQHLSSSVERHLARVAELRAAVEAQGGDLSALEHYDTVMARLRAELRAAERSLAVAFSAAARGEG